MARITELGPGDLWAGHDSECDDCGGVDGEHDSDCESQPPEMDYDEQDNDNSWADA